MGSGIKHIWIRTDQRAPTMLDAALCVHIRVVWYIHPKTNGVTLDSIDNYKKYKWWMPVQNPLPNN